MRRHLADSLRHVHEVTSEVFELPNDEVEAFLNRLIAAPVPPLVFSFYFDLVLALELDNHAEARHLWEQIIRAPLTVSDLLIQDLEDPETSATGARYVRFFLSGAGADFPVYPPRPEEALACRKHIAEALELLHAGDPLLAGEISELVREITLASGSTEKTAYTFDGSSSFMMWGGILLNARRTGGALEMAQMLAHESAHNLLFGMTTEEPLTLNNDEERYKSPLRVDPRPMEGIYHATYVSGRMYRCVKTLLESGTLDPAQQEQAEKDLLINAKCFRDGWQVVHEHGRLSRLGGELIGSARSALDELF